MFKKRQISTANDWSDTEGCKIYTVSVTDAHVDKDVYLHKLADVKKKRGLDWSSIPSFAIFHEGATLQYLVLVWWGNDNEMFVSVSVKELSGWVEDRDKYSFCLWDMEIFWAERNIFIETMYSGTPDIEAYKQLRWCQN